MRKNPLGALLQARCALIASDRRGKRSTPTKRTATSHQDQFPEEIPGANVWRTPRLAFGPHVRAAFSDERHVEVLM
jgi:hypothetical protein